MPKWSFFKRTEAKPLPPSSEESISEWASGLRSKSEGLRDGSEDLQEKYSQIPLRRRPRPKASKKSPGKN